MVKPLQKGKILVLAGWGVLVLSVVYVSLRFGISFSDIPELLRIWFLDTDKTSVRVLLPFCFLLLFIVRPLLMLPTWIMNVLAYFLFGPLKGFLLVVLAEQLSALSFYMFVRYLAGNGIRDKMFHMAKKAGLELDCSGKKDFVTVFLLRLATFPFDVVTALSALAGLKLKDFMLGTFFVSIPWAAFFFLTFDSFERGALRVGVFQALALIVFMVLSIYIAKRSGIIRASRKSQVQWED